MPAFEKKFVNFLSRHMLKIVLVAVVLASIAMRFFVRGWVSADMEWFFLPWYEEIKNGGLFAFLRSGSSDYNVLYLSLLWLVTKLPVAPIIGIKLIPIVFDYVLAVAAAWVLSIMLPKLKKYRTELILSIFVVVLMLPMVFINSAVWGQCDNIYTAFIFFSIGFLLKEKYPIAFLFFAISFCFKLQAVFFLPVFVILYFVKKKFTLLNFLQPIALAIILGLFARSSGDSLFKGLEIYFKQTQSLKGLWFNYPNMWVLFEFVNYDTFAGAGILLTFVILACMLACILVKKWDVKGEALLLMGVWSVLTCCLFLPSMHERYGFTAEVLIWIWVMCAPNLKRMALGVAVMLPILNMYAIVLLQSAFMLPANSSLLNLVAYAAVTVVLLRTMSQNSKESLANEETIIKIKEAVLQAEK